MDGKENQETLALVKRPAPATASANWNSGTALVRRQSATCPVTSLMLTDSR